MGCFHPSSTNSFCHPVASTGHTQGKVSDKPFLHLTVDWVKHQNVFGQFLSSMANLSKCRFHLVKDRNSLDILGVVGI